VTHAAIYDFVNDSTYFEIVIIAKFHRISNALAGFFGAGLLFRVARFFHDVFEHRHHLILVP